MIKVGIVEDETIAYRRLEELICAFGVEKKKEFSVARYDRGDRFLEEGTHSFDILFLDIDLPGKNGFEIAEKIREKDERVVIVFTTNAASLAVGGYRFRALDYIVKPVEKYSFFLTMQKAVDTIETSRTVQIIVSTGEGLKVLSSDEITYIESLGHNILYHTGGKTYGEWGSLLRPEGDLKNAGFVRVGKSYLVNAKYVDCVSRNEIVVAGETIKLGKGKYKDVLFILSEYLIK